MGARTRSPSPRAAATTTLEFASTDGPSSEWGIALDGVSVLPDSPRRRRPAPATDFSWARPTRSRLTVDPGHTADSGVQSESDGAGVIAISASIVPCQPGRHGLARFRERRDGRDRARPRQRASVGAAPGIYTATLTGTLNGHTRSVNIPVTVGAINGIPLLYEAVLIKLRRPRTPAPRRTSPTSPVTRRRSTSPGSQGRAGHRLHGRPANRDELPERLPRQHAQSTVALPADGRRHTDVRRDRGIRGRRAAQRGPAQALRLGTDHRARIARADRSVHRRLAAQRPVAVRVRHQLANRRQRDAEPRATSTSPAGPAGTSSTSPRARASTWR